MTTEQQLRVIELLKDLEPIAIMAGEQDLSERIEDLLREIEP